MHGTSPLAQNIKARDHTYDMFQLCFQLHNLSVPYHDHLQPTDYINIVHRTKNANYKSCIQIM